MSPEVEHHVHESPRSMTFVLSILAALSAVGGFIAVAHFLEPSLPLPGLRPGVGHLERTLVVASIVIAFGGAALALFLYSNGAARAEALRARFSPLHRLLERKYLVDELYALLLVRPLHAISDRVFLRVGDRLLIDGTLHGLAALARRGARSLCRVQTGSLHLYALLVLLGGALLLVLRWLHG
jgi:NADH-quinone oxidoreductase subunit L